MFVGRYSERDERFFTRLNDPEGKKKQNKKTRYFLRKVTGLSISCIWINMKISFGLQCIGKKHIPEHPVSLRC